MKYVSTRGATPPASFSEAIAAGLAPDGGLYIPAALPAAASRGPDATLAQAAEPLLAPFLAGDPLALELSAILEEAFNFPAPLIPLGEADLLELFHGPTGAFKDFGARFLCATLMRARRGARRPLHILVATSGDTGGAVASAFHGRPGARVSILYPKGMVSPTQERQLTCWGGNVASLAVRGDFDACQRLVKAAFSSHQLAEQCDLSSANSINIGRLLPQMTYFAVASFEAARRHGVHAHFVIPSGNLGHATACAFAREMGAPIGEIVLAHNLNRAMPDYLETGVWRPRATVRTIASAMDVGDPSNAERLRFMFPDVSKMRARFRAFAIGDAEIRDAIKEAWRAHGRQLCPHTAAGVVAMKRARASSGAEGRWVVAATAHASKFPEIVAPLIERPPDLHPALRALPQATAPLEIEADENALLAALERAAA